MPLAPEASVLDAAALRRVAGLQKSIVNKLNKLGTITDNEERCKFIEKDIFPEVWNLVGDNAGDFFLLKLVEKITDRIRKHTRKM